jgi:hypothetical protein
MGEKKPQKWKKNCQMVTRPKSLALKPILIFHSRTRLLIICCLSRVRYNYYCIWDVLPHPFTFVHCQRSDWDSNSINK